jgi:hypothetical protein
LASPSATSFVSLARSVVVDVVVEVWVGDVAPDPAVAGGGSGASML